MAGQVYRAVFWAIPKAEFAMWVGLALSSLLLLGKMTTGCYQKLDLAGIEQVALDFKFTQLSLTLASEYITEAELPKESQCFPSQLEHFST